MLVANACHDSGLSFWKPARRGEAIDRADALLERFSLQEHRRRRSVELPGGVRKLLDIAMSLSARPRLLLLDEPTSASRPRSFDDGHDMAGLAKRTGGLRRNEMESRTLPSRVSPYYAAGHAAAPRAGDRERRTAPLRHGEMPRVGAADRGPPRQHPERRGARGLSLTGTRSLGDGRAQRRGKNVRQVMGTAVRPGASSSTGQDIAALPAHRVPRSDGLHAEMGLVTDSRRGKSRAVVVSRTLRPRSGWGWHP